VNVFNKIVTILVLLAAMILIPLFLIFPEQAEVVLRTTADTIQLNLEWLSSQTATSQMGVRLLLGAVGLIVFLICLLLLVLEFVRFGRRTVRLRDESGELVMDGIVGHLSYHIDLLPDVVRVRPKVTSRGKRVRATLYVETAPDVVVPEKSAEIKERARHVIEDQLGLEVDREIKVVIKPVDYRRAPRVRQPARVPGSAPIEPEPQPAELELEPMEPEPQPVELEPPPAEPEEEAPEPEAEAPSELEAMEPKEEEQTIEVKRPSSDEE
jgi:hypothetical protein